MRKQVVFDQISLDVVERYRKLQTPIPNFSQAVRELVKSTANNYCPKCGSQFIDTPTTSNYSRCLNCHWVWSWLPKELTGYFEGTYEVGYEPKEAKPE